MNRAERRKMYKKNPQLKNYIKKFSSEQVAELMDAFKEKWSNDESLNDGDNLGEFIDEEIFDAE